MTFNDYHLKESIIDFYDFYLEPNMHLTITKSIPTWRYEILPYDVQLLS